MNAGLDNAFFVLCMLVPRVTCKNVNFSIMQNLPNIFSEEVSMPPSNVNNTEK